MNHNINMDESDQSVFNDLFADDRDRNRILTEPDSEERDELLTDEAGEEEENARDGLIPEFIDKALDNLDDDNTTQDPSEDDDEDEDLYQCSKCKTFFKKEDELHIHIRTVHPTNIIIDDSDDESADLVILNPSKPTYVLSLFVCFTMIYLL